MIKKTLTLVILLLALHLSPFTLKAQVSDLEKTVTAAHREGGMNHGVLSVCVYNITKGKTVYSYNPQQSLVPGSVNKLFTTGAAFAKLGSDFRFTTKIAMRGSLDRDGVLHGNVYIFGGGDPLLGSYRYRQTVPDSLFDSWTRALKRKGVRRIDGRICYNTSVFDDQTLHDSWQWGDIGNYYAAGVSGLNFHENMYFVYFNPGQRVGHPATCARIAPKNINVLSNCEVTTGPENSGDNVTIYGSPNSNERTYRGTVPLGKNDFRVRGALPNPAKQCADLFASYLRTHGISVSNNSMQVYVQPDSLRPVLDYFSSDFYTIAQYTNLTSNNVYAESIFKYLGYARYGKGTFANGARAVMDYFKDRKLDTDGILISDGSGLSVENRATTDFICRYLTALTKEDFFDEFLHSIAVVGESGTARNLLPNLPQNITIHLKTGTLTSVRAYAGYIDAANGDRLAFAIIANNFNCPSSTASDKLNSILRKIATLY